MGATYDDSHVFERGGEIEPQAAGQRDAPVLKVSVKDPVKKVPRLAWMPQNAKLPPAAALLADVEGQ